ncbi:ABC transporter substrate-binding protein [Acinetobacter qingfengensis]|uniref:ABC transporter substrate-binding protein n=1 Tax=Acinetobacter qingfengensis TaxID=1262585 RepID=A0A1E7R451_9GAMM|nr:ABC transporter substrate-binding protein [Acinetobacter qingfengensis]
MGGCGKENTSAQAASGTTAAASDAAKSDFYSKELAKLQANLTPINAPQNPEAIRKIPKDFKFVNPGYFTVAAIAGAPPLSVLGPDNKTYVGTEIDIARLIADSLGLKLKIVQTSWEDWPLGVSSGKYDAAITNVTVTKDRKKKFDFATYRRDVLAFYVASNSKIKEIKGPDDISGLKIIVGSGTNQEKVLLDWIEDNKRKGLTPGQALYYDDSASASLALQSGRVDALFGPNVAYAWQAANGVKIRLAGTALGGGNRPAELGVTIKKGNGLVDAVQVALNGVIKNGEYQKVLQRWGTQAEAVTESQINPPGLGD